MLDFHLWFNFFPWEFRSPEVTIAGSGYETVCSNKWVRKSSFRSAVAQPLINCVYAFVIPLHYK